MPSPRPAKQRVTLHLDDMDSVIAHLEQDGRRLQQFELCYCFVSLLTVFASLNNFELSEAKNMRIILYCAMALVLDLARKASRQQHIIDPLALHLRTKVLRVGQQLLVVDMLYLLVRVVHHIPLSQSLLVIAHYFYTLAHYLRQDRQSKPQPLTPAVTLSYERLQPALLFVLCKIIPSEFSEVSLLFLLSSTLNLMVLSEVGRIVLFDNELTLNFWHERLLQVDEVKGKKPNPRLRRLFVKNSLILLSVLVLVQNLLLVFEVLRFEVAIGLIQTLTAGGFILGQYQQIREDNCRS